MDVGKQFSEYKLNDHLNKVLAGLGFEHSTPIQEQAIPLVVSGQDVAGLAQTGTGKTAAFLLPLIERVMRSEKKSGDEELDSRAFVDWKPGHFNLILVPTRELAEQVKDCALDFLKDSEHRAVVVYGGVSIEKQIEQINKGFTFLIATPGRLIDLYKENKIDLKQVRSVTFDEADRMFDMGFKDDMKFILRRIPENRQLLLFSATLNLEVFNVAYEFGSNPVEIKVSQDKMTADNVLDYIFHVGRDEKPSHLLGLIEKIKPKQIIIFTNFKNSVERIAEFLNKNNHKAVGISSLLSQGQRKSVMTRFKDDDGENFLVATDVAARGLDIEGVDLVINYELPDDAENYVHRIGRTGRAGEKGKAFSFVSDKDVEAFDRIKKYLNRDIATEWLDDSELPKDFAPMPRGELLYKKTRSKDSRGGYEKDRNNKRRDFKKKDYKKDDNKKRESHENRKRHTPKEGDSSSPSSSTDYKKSAEGQNVHRDKRSGRHKAKDRDDRNKQQTKRTHQSSDQNENKHKSKPRRHRTKRRAEHNTNRPVAASAKAKPGMLGKITGALKSLFR